VSINGTVSRYGFDSCQMAKVLKTRHRPRRSYEGVCELKGLAWSDVFNLPSALNREEYGEGKVIRIKVIARQIRSAGRYALFGLAGGLSGRARTPHIEQACETLFHVEVACRFFFLPDCNTPRQHRRNSSPVLHILPFLQQSTANMIIYRVRNSLPSCA
jgi:hypothetical protein